MPKKRINININFIPLLTLGLILIAWQFVTTKAIIPAFMLPSPKAVLQALLTDWPQLAANAKVTLLEAIVGLFAGVLLGFVLAVIMDHIPWLKQAIYPLLVLSQTIPTVALAPLLIVWLGFGILPKVVLIILTIFFPVALSLLNGFAAIDPDEILLLQSMGAKKYQIFLHIKLPASLGSFFAALKIAVTYALIGAVVSEWLGGFEGLGVYMTRVRKSYSFDKMFAVILLISALSMLLLGTVFVLEKIAMPWKKGKK
ncbi:nitrate ABC transporter permease [Enterococcus saigonensis]|uniref:Nitrate ABC transporter permease n=1 Tax=Enterococcus saigonensis TaxID=1805431 RepID=A0A679IDG5_9ENTE|nr:ABC transporter permease [Enterococcus saigonensis]BCA86293.1 nitrate ABC transporter permease [Enterococcus saigonensis]